MALDDWRSIGFLSLRANVTTGYVPDGAAGEAPAHWHQKRLLAGRESALMRDEKTFKKLYKLRGEIYDLIRMKEHLDKRIDGVRDVGYKVLDESNITRDTMPKKGGDDQEFADLIYSFWW